jgi:hypothetical protein
MNIAVLAVLEGKHRLEARRNLNLKIKVPWTWRFNIIPACPTNVQHFSIISVQAFINLASKVSGLNHAATPKVEVSSLSSRGTPTSEANTYCRCVGCEIETLSSSQSEVGPGGHSYCLKPRLIGAIDISMCLYRVLQSGCIVSALICTP